MYGCHPTSDHDQWVLESKPTATKTINIDKGNINIVSLDNSVIKVTPRWTLALLSSRARGVPTTAAQHDLLASFILNPSNGYFAEGPWRSQFSEVRCHLKTLYKESPAALAMV